MKKSLTTIIIMATVIVSTVACGNNVEVENTEVVENASTIEEVGEEVVTAKVDSEDKEDEIIADDFTTVNSTSDVAVKKNESTVSANSGNTSSKKSTTSNTTFKASAPTAETQAPSASTSTAEASVPAQINYDKLHVERTETRLIGYHIICHGYTGTVWFSNEDVVVVHGRTVDELEENADAVYRAKEIEYGVPAGTWSGHTPRLGCTDYSDDTSLGDEYATKEPIYGTVYINANGDVIGANYNAIPNFYGEHFYPQFDPQ